MYPFVVYIRQKFCMCVKKKGWACNQDDVLHSKDYRESMGTEAAFELIKILQRVLLDKEHLGVKCM